MNWVSLIRSCVHCGGFGFVADHFCNGCDLELKTKAEKIVRHQQDFMCRHAWFWAKESSLVGSAIYLLKGGHEKALAQTLVDQFIIQQGLGKDSNYCFVPAPAKIPGVLDHAFAVAEAFRQGLGGRLLTALVYEVPTAQKRRNRQQRKDLRFKLEVPLKKSEKVVFVDDVLTTGATAHAAWRALERPANFEAWIPFFRPLELAIHCGR